MAEVFTPSVRIHRVTTRRRNLRELNCPLEPELLVAEFADELPPEVARAVREHIVLCETCGARSRALRAPYELLSSLGHEPVASVPDLRDTVGTHAGSWRFYKNLAHVAANLGRGGAIGATGILGMALVAALLIGGIVVTANAQSVPRSENALTHVHAAGAGGVLLAQTDKLVTVKDHTGQAWQVGEVIAVSEQTGAVLRSMPASDDQLQSGKAALTPLAEAVSADGKVIYEVTAPDGSHAQAVVAFDTATGAVRFVTRLSKGTADAVTVAPDGSVAYVGLASDDPMRGGVRALVLDAKSGAVLRTLAPRLATTIPVPPQPGSLPSSVFPTTTPPLDASGLKASVAAHGDLAVSPDGQWLFDVVLLSNNQGPQYAVVRRINPATGETAQALALSGDFTLAKLVMSAPATGTGPAQLYLVKGSPDAQCLVLDPSATGPTLLGDVPLGGPAAPQGVRFAGGLGVSPAAGGGRVYITQNATAENGQIAGHDLWLVDTQGMSLVSHRIDDDSADAVEANLAGGAKGSTFIVRGGDVLLINQDLVGTPVRWLNLDGGHAVTALLGTAAGS